MIVYLESTKLLVYLKNTKMAAMAKKPTCSEPGCGKQFRTIVLLRNHLVNDHGLNHPELEFIFQTEEELLAWKQSYERDNIVFFR